jgi:hypothetical protein
MKTFRTAFFQWIPTRHIWIANDPTDKRRKWIIEPAPAHDPPTKYRLVYTFDVLPIEVEYGNDPIYLGWKAVAKKVDEIAEHLYKFNDCFSEENSRILTEFLQSLNQGVQNASDVASSGRSNVDDTISGPTPSNFL